MDAKLFPHCRVLQDWGCHSTLCLSIINCWPCPDAYSCSSVSSKGLEWSWEQICLSSMFFSVVLVPFSPQKKLWGVWEVITNGDVLPFVQWNVFCFYITSLSMRLRDMEPGDIQEPTLKASQSMNESWCLSLIIMESEHKQIIITIITQLSYL